MPKKNRRRLSGAWAMGPPQTVPASAGAGATDAPAPAKKSKSRRRKSIRRVSVGGGNPFAPPSAPASAKDKQQLTEMFTSCLKLSSENRINQKNTWSLGLIDHMDDTLKEDGKDDDVNFQKASCAIDASVKIYSHRVDDTWSSSYRALENLSRTGKDEDAAAAGGGGDSDSDGEGAPRRRAPSAATLEKNEASITLRAVEETCDVDPLFTRMAKQFNESGAAGLLLNTLSTYDGLRVVFDSSERGHVEPPAPVPADEQPAPEMVDASALALPAHFAALPLSATLDGFHDALVAAGDATAGAPSALAQSFAAADDSSDDDDAEPFVADASAFDFGDDGGFDFEEIMGPNDSFAAAMQREDALEADDEAPAAPVAPAAAARPAGRGIALMEMADGDEYTFFTQKAATAWAPKHWKFRSAGSQGPVDDALEPAGVKAAGSRRARKPAVVLDFAAGAPEGAFTAPRSAAATQLTKAVIARNYDSCGDLLLPPDVRFSAKDLATLFMRPRVLRMAAAAAGGEDSDGDDDGDDGMFAGALDDSGFSDSGFDDDVCFNFADAGAAAGPGGLDIEGLIDDVAQPAHVVNKVDISFATKAKRVDVRRLKQDLWAEIESRGSAPEAVASPGPENDSNSDSEAEAEAEDFPKKPAPTVHGEMSFGDTMNALAPHNSAEVTTPFYFICLLHLCNENGLQLEGKEDLSDLTISQPAVFADEMPTGGVREGLRSRVP